MDSTVFNPAQQELLNMMSYVKTPESLKELRKVIASYFAQKAKESITKMWENGELSDEKIEGFKTLHERTPYKR